MNFKWALSEFLRNFVIKYQEIYIHYLCLQQQKKQFTLKYLRQLKNQFLQLNNEIWKFNFLLIKFQLKLLQSNKNRFVLLFLKINYNMNEQIVWITRNEKTNFKLVNILQSSLNFTFKIKENSFNDTNISTETSLKFNCLNNDDLLNSENSLNNYF